MDATYIFILLIVACALYIGWSLRGVSFMLKIGSNPDYYINILQKIKELNEQEDSELPDEVKSKGTELLIERVNDMLYAYAKETNQFIAQGRDLKSLLETAHDRFPGKIFFGEIPEDSSAKELA